MKFDFHPYIGAGPLRFGMTAHEITRILGAPNTTEICREYPEQIGVSEYAYDEKGIFVYFSKDSGVDTISFTNNVINFAGMNLRTVPIRSLREWV
ncbi:hypothetical protein K1W69_24505 [Hoeflea sp. WL0058]|uniref:DUF7738 domain-containing protein n=1 Tax=Flavimaribacter sediminis TaxID=2865987 RepID=A0AAE2ZQR0_9HYPH|nr:hypothetical protein [Flavimaribacter sediminis]MBW8640376.1 hypothetical protein [Flavimaribacter sediminis]